MRDGEQADQGALLNELEHVILIAYLLLKTDLLNLRDQDLGFIVI